MKVLSFQYLHFLRNYKELSLNFFEIIRLIIFFNPRFPAQRVFLRFSLVRQGFPLKIRLDRGLLSLRIRQISNSHSFSLFSP